MDGNSSTRNPNPNPDHDPSKPTVALHFMRALARIHQTSSADGSSHASRSRRIRRAAYRSMAYSAGHRRAWSRALLRKLRQRARQGAQRPDGRAHLVIRRRVHVMRPRSAEPNRAETLRRLVPGGTGMDYCNLLEETADYISCLSTQVRLMRTIADSISS